MQPEKHAERVVEDFRRVPETAAENLPVIIEIAGQSFPFREPVAVQALVMRGRGYKLVGQLRLVEMYQALAPLMETAEAKLGADASHEDLMATVLAVDIPLESMGHVWENFPLLLDFVCDVLKITTEQRKAIEAIADDKIVGNLLLAVNTIMAVLNRPMSGGRPATASGTPAKIRLTNGKPEMP